MVTSGTNLIETSPSFVSSMISSEEAGRQKQDANLGYDNAQNSRNRAGSQKTDDNSQDAIRHSALSPISLEESYIDHSHDDDDNDLNSIYLDTEHANSFKTI
jgi:hypothetical protein